MNSITKLAFSAAMLGAAALSIAGRPAIADQTGPLNPNAVPLRFAQTSHAGNATNDGVHEAAPPEHPADSSVHHAIPPLSSLSPDAIDVMSNGRLYWYDNGLWYADENSVVKATQPPADIVVPKLPPMYATGFYDDGTPYYYAQGVYYVRAERGYAVTQAPDAHGPHASHARSPANPVQSATTMSERAKAFAEQERVSQRLSTP
jgi:uncharacterized protein DUF6515